MCLSAGRGGNVPVTEDDGLAVDRYLQQPLQPDENLVGSRMPMGWRHDTRFDGELADGELW